MAETQVAAVELITLKIPLGYQFGRRDYRPAKLLVREAGVSKSDLVEQCVVQDHLVNPES